MSYREYVAYSIFAAEQVIEVYEKRYPEDKRPRRAIEATKLCLENPNNKNRSAAWSAAEINMKIKILEYSISLIQKEV